MKRFLFLLLFAPLLALAAGPVCLPEEAGGTGTKSTSSLIHDGKATWWWCPAGVSTNGYQSWAMEWYGWSNEWDQFFGMLGFRPNDAETVRQAWQVTRQVDYTRSYFPTNVIMAAEMTRPKLKKVTP
jgi:hypothetical protein